MNDSPPTLQDRLAAYRQPLDEALSQNPAPSSATMQREHADGAGIVDVFDLELEEVTKASRWPKFAIAAVCVALIAGAGLLIVRRNEPSTGVSSNNFDNTAPLACPGPTGSADVGDPAPELKLDDSEFIVALPAATPPRVLAVRALLNPVAGEQCIAFNPDSIATSVDQSTGIVTVTLNPPTSASPLEVRLTIDRTAESIGVTRIDGLTSFKVDQSTPIAVLNLAGDLPQSAASIDVKFRTPSGVVDIAASPAQAPAIPLTPADASIEPNDPTWVTFVIRDAAGKVLDTGGTTLPA